MTDKTKSQTYNFLLNNKSIEDIKKHTNIEVKEKSRHGGITYKLIEINNTNNQQLNDEQLQNIDDNLEIVVTNLTDNEKDQKSNDDVLTKLKNFLTTSISNTEEISKLQSINQKLEKENQQLKNEIEKLKLSKLNLLMIKILHH